MPKSEIDDHTIRLLEKNFLGINNFSDQLYENKDNLHELINKLFIDLNPKIIEDKKNTPKITFFCKCSRKRSIKALKLLSKEELESMLKEDKEAELICKFCNEIYTIKNEELKVLIRFK